MANITFSAPLNPNAFQFYLIASALNVDGNSLATTTLNWQNSATAANSIPVIARCLRKTGTLALTVAALRLNSTIIQPITAASSALMGAGADPVQFLLDTTTSATVLPVSGNFDIVVSSINVSPATFDVLVYGYRIA